MTHVHRYMDLLNIAVVGYWTGVMFGFDVSGWEVMVQSGLFVFDRVRSQVSTEFSQVVEI